MMASSSDPTSFEWSDFLDFNLDETLYAPLPDIGSGPEPDQSQPSENSGRVRKRDPRLVCSNFLAGRVPCACPEMDAMLAEEEESGLPGKKRVRMARASGGSPMRCQVPGCEVDISELKGYHKRHRVCLQCATASAVVLDGESKRYCQQCGKFHLLSDFDEGKRSCRRKLERHNNRRRRKPNDSKGGMEKEAQQVVFADDPSADDDAGKALNETFVGQDVVGLSSQIEERQLLESDGNASTLCSALDSQNIQGDSVASIALPNKVHIHGPKQNPRYKHSPSYGDDTNTFSSICPTGRISFKLYDWNPAEFPRRLRHQILQWLASMPIELEGYIRPGCTILTAFIAMPKPMWLKLLEEPALCIKNLVNSPGSILSGRGRMLVYLNHMIFRVMEDENSVVKVRMKDRSPKLHYIHPNCFEAGRPMEFLACGSDLLQSKFRFLVSLAGRYLVYNICVSSLRCMKGDSINSFDHQLVKISVPQTDATIIGPAFIEVENQSGLSNFIPILIGDKETCTEMEILQQKIDQESLPSSPACQMFALRQARFSEILLDVAWSLKKPVSGQRLTSSHAQRFNFLLDLLIEKECHVILGRIICSLKSAIDENLVTGISEVEMRLLRRKMDIAEDMLDRKLWEKELNMIHGMDGDAHRQISEEDIVFVPAYDMENPRNMMESGHKDPLLNKEVVMNVVSLHAKTGKFVRFRPLVTSLLVICICLGVCAVAFHPRRVSQMAVTVRMCLLDSS